MIIRSTSHRFSIPSLQIRVVHVKSILRPKHSRVFMAMIAKQIASDGRGCIRCLLLLENQILKILNRKQCQPISNSCVIALVRLIPSALHSFHHHA